MESRKTNKDKYTLLIVDDEVIISDGLKHLMEEEFKEEFMVYNCYSAKKALEIFKYRMPDIVLSDVKMPGMNGIEMAKKMREWKPDVHILYLSGYDEFEYVYSAIKQGADDYILKTDGDETIVGGMNKMLQKVEEEHAQRREKISIQYKMEYMEPAYKRQVIVSLLDGSIQSQAEFDTLMDRLENPIEDGAFLLLLIGGIGEEIEVDKEMDRELQEEILKLIKDMLIKSYGNKISKVHGCIYRKHFLWLLETKEKEMGKLMLVSLLDMHSLIFESWRFHIYFAIASDPVSWEHIPKKYDELWRKYKESTLCKENYAIAEHGIQEESGQGEESRLLQEFGPVSERLRLLEYQLLNEDFNEYRKQLAQILTILSGARRHSMYALEIYYSLANMLVSYINKTNIRMRLSSKIQILELFDPGNFTNWSQASAYIEKLIDAVEEVSVNSENDMNISQTGRVKTYILSHLGEELSLSLIGERMGFNHVYLARIFKQTEGISIRAYIEKCRMELAMRLLSNSEIKIYEIGQKCGYQNTAYFIKIFRSYYDMTPQEYRDHCK